MSQHFKKIVLHFQFNTANLRKKGARRSAVYHQRERHVISSRCRHPIIKKTYENEFEKDEPIVRQISGQIHNQTWEFTQPTKKSISSKRGALYIIQMQASQNKNLKKWICIKNEKSWTHCVVALSDKFSDRSVTKRENLRNPQKIVTASEA